MLVVLSNCCPHHLTRTAAAAVAQVTAEGCGAGSVSVVEVTLAGQKVTDLLVADGLAVRPQPSRAMKQQSEYMIPVAAGPGRGVMNNVYELGGVYKPMGSNFQKPGRGSW